MVREIKSGLAKELLDLVADPCWPQIKHRHTQIFRLEQQHRLAIKPILRVVAFRIALLYLKHGGMLADGRLAAIDGKDTSATKPRCRDHQAG
ncbi:hypothetical protein [Chloroflexus sp.]|uniref:hypothetical protein n=1 Tax=Chloroflexus sp. TaxID=1904827 RepID=UPI002ACD34A3|nr:hypothetical protein [Chloroflexus sp.]